MTAPSPQTIEDAHYAKYYSRKPVTIVRGSGALLYDLNGKEYVDCAGGYGTCIVGHAHPRVVEAIAEQAHRLISSHSSTYNDARAKLLSKLMTITTTGLNRVFLSNSGAEAVECAIKVARKSTGRRKIVALRGAYHGKTHGALSATWDSKYRKSFEPLVPDFTHIPFANAEAAKAAISNDTAAIIFEPIQGEGGIRVPPSDWLQLLENLADDAGALLIADEIQSGFGRTGKMFACDHYGVNPDILCLGKGIASGLPIGVTIASDTTMGALSLGEHTSTFGGNPVVCAAAAATIDVLLEERLVENAAKVGDYFKEQLLNLQKERRIVREVRGMGLMLAAEMRFDVHQILLNSLEEGVLCLDAGRNIIRFLPPLCLATGHVDRVISVLDAILEKEELAKLSSSTPATNA
jgi:acetylornithine/LysW-gamma-L-lysine aminotransferase